MRKLALLGTMLAIWMTCQEVRAVTNVQEDAVGPRALGMGLAHRAVVTGNEAIFFNPAGMSISKKYSVETIYHFNLGTDTHVFGVSVVDSKSAAYALGFSYSYISSHPYVERGAQEQIERKGHVVHLALSYPIMKNLSAGLGAKYMTIDHNGRSAVKAVTLDFGLLYYITREFSVAAVGYGLTNAASIEAPIAMALAASYGSDGFYRLALDWVLDFTTVKGKYKSQIHIGGEYVIKKMVPFRLGFTFDTVRDEESFHIGLGFIYKKGRTAVNINVGYQQSVKSPDNRNFQFSIKMFL